MSKGARNRKKRQAARERDPSDLVDQLFEAKTLDQFTQLLAARPLVLSDPVLDYLGKLQTMEGFGANIQAWRDLVLNARDNPGAAWREFQTTMDAMAEVGEELEVEMGEIDAAISEHRFDDAIALADTAISRAHAAGLGLAVSAVQGQRAKALFQRTTGNRSENIEAAIEGFEEAISRALKGEPSADLLMSLGIAYMERLRGDQAENIEQAIGLMRASLGEATEPATLATIQTNLATALLRRERGGRAGNLREGVEFCHAALEYRSPERDTYDWAFTQLNLGALLQDLAGLSEADPADAAAAYERVIEEADRMRVAWQLGAAHYALGRMQRIAATQGAEELLETAEMDEEAQLEQARNNERLLEAARKHLEAARSHAEDDPDPQRRGRLLHELADVLDRLDDQDTAIDVWREALTLLRPTGAPRECTWAGGRLGDLLSQRGLWDEAASAFRDAIQAAEITFHGRLDPEARQREVRQAGNLARWAAFAMACAGDPVEAALVLEGGRARELRQRLGVGAAEEARLDDLPQEARDAYLDATRALASAALDPSGSPASRPLQEVLAAIRAAPGFGDFAAGARDEDLVGAVEPGWPLLYVNPTPYGTLILRVYAQGDRVTADAVVLEQPTSLEVLMRLLAGDAAQAPELMETIEWGSYLAGASGFGNAEDRNVQYDVEHVLPWIGESIAKPIRESLAEIGANGVTLIPCGPIGLAPLHAAPWPEAGAPGYLVDEFDIRYAPSALLAAASLEKAGSRADMELRLVAIANPDGTLDAAEPEVEEIVAYFDEGRMRCATGPAGNWDFLRRHAAEATHLHLACHACAGMMGERETGVRLSEGLVPAQRFTELGELSARLTVISACQSAVVDISHLPDEVFSVSTTMLAAGSACVIASLWSVRDDTTALLMTRLYEEMLINGHRPPEALRRAQLWLRDLTDADADAFLTDHPALEAEFRRRAEKGDRPGRRAASNKGAAAEEKPYTSPDYWAPFIAVGA